MHINSYGASSRRSENAAKIEDTLRKPETALSILKQYYTIQHLLGGMSDENEPVEILEIYDVHVKFLSAEPDSFYFMLTCRALTKGGERLIFASSCPTTIPSTHRFTAYGVLPADAKRFYVSQAEFVCPAQGAHNIKQHPALRNLRRAEAVAPYLIEKQLKCPNCGKPFLQGEVMPNINGFGGGPPNPIPAAVYKYFELTGTWPDMTAEKLITTFMEDPKGILNNVMKESTVPNFNPERDLVEQVLEIREIDAYESISKIDAGVTAAVRIRNVAGETKHVFFVTYDNGMEAVTGLSWTTGEEREVTVGDFKMLCSKDMMGQPAHLLIGGLSKARRAFLPSSVMDALCPHCGEKIGIEDTDLPSEAPRVINPKDLN